MYFGGNIKYLRKKAGISRKQAADHIGVSEKNYGHYETGYSMPKLTTAYKLSKYYRTSLTTLIEKDLIPNAPTSPIRHFKDHRIRT